MTSAKNEVFTGESILKFDNKNINIKKHIKATFYQVRGLITDSRQMLWLSNAACKWKTDPNAFHYRFGNLINEVKTRYELIQCLS